ncbi:diablo homolog, mitochondrial-like isoform X1 [Takifugu rubripes]|uniref:Direct IAP-binding protein with low pI n=1 Tax=Takifugu rubripes TaxID=31033 RepID=A0A3B5K713_TAKRU|nr:diablo homolog, mitochondrial-like isoform X1 [Takifugu rubripes]|eukprot:XP_011606865.1 PREDICTED: diablo homolog, mitochondrial-like isoform X1 [Takifugu rubripes]
MQAVRQCSVCAGRVAGGHLWSQVNVSGLQKTVLRKGTCVRFQSRSESVLVGSRMSAFGDRTDGPNRRRVSSGPQDFPWTQVENLSHDSLIRRAASLVTNSSCTFLSQSTLALTEALSEYSKAVYTRIAVQRRYLASLGKLTPAEKDSILEVINSQRAQASARMDECRHFESNWINAVNMCKLAADTANSSGAEQASTTLQTHVQVAQAQVDEARRLTEDVNKKLAETKVEEIQRMAEYAAFLDDNQEPELHEAYLRED